MAEPQLLRPTGVGWTGVGWTGTRRLTDDMRRFIDTAIDKLHGAVWVITGGCVGVDAYVAEVAFRRGLHVHTILPADRSRVDPQWRDHCTTYEEMSRGTTYRDRNERIVALTTTDMFAVPEASEDDPISRRSGTWMTVRIARRARKWLTIFDPGQAGSGLDCIDCGGYVSIEQFGRRCFSCRRPAQEP